MHGFDSFSSFDWLVLTAMVLLPVAFVLVLTVLVFRMAVGRMKSARGFEVKATPERSVEQGESSG